MEEKIDSLPRWTFGVREVSPGAYKVSAIHDLGCSIELMGTDPEELIEEVTKSAEKMERELQELSAKRARE